jgi:hypothetical protein
MIWDRSILAVSRDCRMLSLPNAFTASCCINTCRHCSIQSKIGERFCGFLQNLGHVIPATVVSLWQHLDHILFNQLAVRVYSLRCSFRWNGVAYPSGWPDTLGAITSQHLLSRANSAASSYGSQHPGNKHSGPNTINHWPGGPRLCCDGPDQELSE